MDQSWGKNADMRQLKVRATNPEGRTIEVGVFTPDYRIMYARITLNIRTQYDIDNCVI